MSPAILPDPLQPFQGTDVVAFVLGLAALLYGALWWRDRERGMGWFALSMAMIALFTATDRQHLPRDIYMLPTPWLYMLMLGLVCLAIGLVGYLDVPQRQRRTVLWAMLLPVAAYTGLLVVVGLTGLAIVRAWSNLLFGISLAVMGTIAWQAALREPKAGHAWVGAALWSIPVVSLVLAATQRGSVMLRYWGMLPIIMLALTLLTVSLLRRRRELEAEVQRRRAAESELTALNASLETVVAQRTADLQEMVAGLESFNRSVSHDLRGPLGGIAGVARLADEALQRGDDALARRVLPMIASQAEDATRLMAALLSLARVGDAPLRRQPVDLRRLVESVVEQIRLEHAGQALPQIEIDALPEVQADAELLQRVFANLIGNAIKFTRSVSAPCIRVGATRTAGQVEVFVRDNGVGFDAEAAAGLFAPFVRLHGRQFDGHGVGLSIVRRAVERHGGRVWAEGAPGQGAVFRFSLPA